MFYHYEHFFKIFSSKIKCPPQRNTCHNRISRRYPFVFVLNEKKAPEGIFFYQEKFFQTFIKFSIKISINVCLLLKALHFIDLFN